MKRRMMAIALAAAVPAAALAAGAAELSFGGAIEICRTAVFKDGAEAKAAIAALPAEQRPSVAIVCAAYEIGARDTLGFLQAAQAQGASI
jgi:hypothetical protein